MIPKSTLGTAALEEFTPEYFGAKGNGIADDTAAWQRAIRAVPVVLARPGSVYRLSESLEPESGAPLQIRGLASGRSAPVLKASPSFRGFLLRPTSSYDLRDLRIEGNGFDGCHLIGNDRAGSSGFSTLDSLDLRQADTFVNFGSQWEHPLGLSYSRVYGQTFRNAGIVIGGSSSNYVSGESLWSLNNVVLTNARSTSLSADEVSIIRGIPGGDRLSWKPDNAATYGWIVLRSANGKSDWHVPPNWPVKGNVSKSFVSLTKPGDYWHYAVVRKTIGMSLNRGKAVSLGTVQAEYCGVGLILSNIAALSLQTFYSESRSPNKIPIPNVLGILATGYTYGVINSAWLEGLSYGMFIEKSCKLVLASARGNNLFYSLVLSDADLPDGKWNSQNSISGTTPEFFQSTAEVR